MKEEFALYILIGFTFLIIISTVSTIFSLNQKCKEAGGEYTVSFQCVEPRKVIIPNK
jgi:hypothetical protein